MVCLGKTADASAGASAEKKNEKVFMFHMECFCCFQCRAPFEQTGGAAAPVKKQAHVYAEAIGLACNCGLTLLWYAHARAHARIGRPLADCGVRLTDRSSCSQRCWHGIRLACGVPAVHNGAGGA